MTILSFTKFLNFISTFHCNDYSAVTFGTDPQLCTSTGEPAQASPFNTSACILGYDYVTNTTIYNSSCLGQWPPPTGDPYFYCGFGPLDDPGVESTGVCCPVGWRSYWDDIAGKWTCKESLQCGVDPSLSCDFDFDLAREDWYSSAYYGDALDWCNTQVTNLLYPLEGLPGYEGSTGCCLIPKYGEINYWLDEGNVKIWG